MSPIIIATLAAGAIILIALGIALAGSGGVTLERLERYAAADKKEGTGEKTGLADPSPAPRPSPSSTRSSRSATSARTCSATWVPRTSSSNRPSTSPCGRARSSASRSCSF
jgi:hypothetical protein